jgi:hypothetical protein
VPKDWHKLHNLRPELLWEGRVRLYKDTEELQSVIYPSKENLLYRIGGNNIRGWCIYYC